VSDLRGDSLLWDADAGAFSAAHGGESPNRLVNLAAGQAATDAVNKGQLDTVAQTAESARSDAAKAQQSAGVAQASAAGALQAAETAQGE
ncbi:hypothetical protein, partial [Mycobacterium tuberculosis]|uniref:hypothetical protein n=1 Tax=Mycobacterium tuberculosis TaxID=1773 RepID=UPI00254DCBE4